jgi:hypothetical protein
VQDDEEEDDPDEILEHPKYVTMITSQTTDEIKFYKLQDLFTNFDALTESEKQKNYFRVRLQVLKVDPEDVKECCVAMCVENGETISCKDLPANGKATCNDKPTKLIWQI